MDNVVNLGALYSEDRNLSELPYGKINVLLRKKNNREKHRRLVNRLKKNGFPWAVSKHLAKFIQVTSMGQVLPRPQLRKYRKIALGHSRNDGLFLSLIGFQQELSTLAAISQLLTAALCQIFLHWNYYLPKTPLAAQHFTMRAFFLLGLLAHTNTDTSPTLLLRLVRESGEKTAHKLLGRSGGAKNKGKRRSPLTKIMKTLVEVMGGNDLQTTTNEDTLLEQITSYSSEITRKHKKISSIIVNKQTKSVTIEADTKDHQFKSSTLLDAFRKEKRKNIKA